MNTQNIHVLLYSLFKISVKALMDVAQMSTSTYGFTITIEFELAVNE